MQVEGSPQYSTPPQGRMDPMERPPVVIDIGAVVDIAAELLAIGDELAHLTRPLRLPMMNPASDPFTVRICTHINTTRASLGTIGTDAGEELTRMAEFLLSSAFNLHHIARWTTLAVRGLSAAPLARRSLGIAPRPHRADPVQQQPLPDWSLSTDGQALACAAALSAGDDKVPELYYPDPRGLRALGERLRACSAQMMTAWANAQPASAKYEDFAQWIGSDLVSACERSAVTAHRWIALYADVRKALNTQAASIMSAQAALVDGSALNDAVTPGHRSNDVINVKFIRDRLDPYANFDSAVELCVASPRLKV